MRAVGHREARRCAAPPTASTDDAATSVRHGSPRPSHASRCGNAEPTPTRADDDAERRAAALEKPARGDLHAWRIDPRERRARCRSAGR